MPFDWRDLYQAAHNAKNPLHRLALLQEGERMFESAGVEEMLFIFRMDISATCLKINKPELGVASLTWCLATFDKNPNLGHHLEWVLDRLTMALNVITDYPQVSLAQHEAILEDYKQRISQAGLSLQDYLEVRSMIASFTGHLQDAYNFRIQARELNKRGRSTHSGSDVNSMVFILYQMGKWEAALKEAEPIIKGAITSRSIHLYSAPMIAKCYLKIGDRAKAIEYNDLGARLTEYDHPVGVMAELLENYALIGLISIGIDFLERWVSYLKLGRPLKNYRFYASALLLLRAALVTNPELQLRLPESFIAENELKDSRADTLLTHFSNLAETMGKAFNKRNGNTHWTDYFLQSL